MLNLSLRKGCAAVAVVAAAVAFAMPAQAQRLSLAERVAHLEQQLADQGGAGNAVEMVNRNSALQAQVQQLQGQVEELRHEIQQMQQRGRDQYIDLDSRLGRLEGRAPVGATGEAESGAAAPPLQDIQLGATPPPAPPLVPATPAAPAISATDPADLPTDSDLSAAPVADPAAEKAAYDAAFGALRDGRYDESARAFQAFVQQYPNSELAGNAYYWLGESYYVTQNYQLALEQFQTLLARFPNGQKAPDALLKVGYSQYELKQWEQAQATLDEVVRRYPDTTVSRLAEGRLRALALEGHGR
jgi:tol-pal system protein YbgF